MFTTADKYRSLVFEDHLREVIREASRGGVRFIPILLRHMADEIERPPCPPLIPQPRRRGS